MLVSIPVRTFATESVSRFGWDKNKRSSCHIVFALLATGRDSASRRQSNLPRQWSNFPCNSEKNPVARKRKKRYMLHENRMNYQIEQITTLKTVHFTSHVVLFTHNVNKSPGSSVRMLSSDATILFLEFDTISIRCCQNIAISIRYRYFISK